MDVKSLIQYFNKRSRPSENSQPATRPAPVYHLNGKVKHLVQKFSKSRHTLLHPVPALQYHRLKSTSTDLDKLQNGGNAIRGGVFQISREARQVSKEGSNTKYVSPIQYQSSLQQQEPKQQHQKQVQAPVRLAKVVSEAASQRSGLGPAHVQEPSTKSISTFGRSRYPHRSPTLVAKSLERSRADSIDLVVMSARNSILRKSKPTNLTLKPGMGGGSLPNVGAQLTKEHPVPQILSKGTEPLSLVRKKLIVSCPVEELKLSFRACELLSREQTIPEMLHLALLAQKCQRIGQSTRLAPNPTPSPEILGIYKLPPYYPAKPSSKQSWTYNTRQISLLLSPAPPSSDLAIFPGAVGVEHANMQERNEPQAFKVPYFTRVPSKRLSLPRYDAPQDDNIGWMNGSHYVLQGNNRQKARSTPTLLNNLGGSIFSWESWSTPTPPETSPSPVFLPLTPPQGQLRNYILHLNNTVGQYPPLAYRKMELIQLLPPALSAEKSRLLPYHPCFSTLSRRDSFSDSSNQIKFPASPASTKEREPQPEPNPKGNIKRLSRAVCSGHDCVSVLPSPSYLGVVDIHRVLRYANSIDIENKRYASRRKQ